MHNGYWKCMDNLSEKNQLEEIYKKKNYMENKVILNSTELTGIMNRDEMNKLSLVIEEKKWNEYRKKYDEAANLKCC